MMFSLVAICLAGTPDWVTAAPMTATPEQLFEAATQLDPELAVGVLLDEWTYDFDAEGRQSRSRRLIWRAQDSAAIDDWGLTVAEWAPWSEERPVIRARVLTGTREILLDPSTISGSDVQVDGQTYSDSRQLNAPLPGVTKGALVEEITTWTDAHPFLGGGDSLALRVTSGFEGTLHLVRQVDVHRD